MIHHPKGKKPFITYLLVCVIMLFVPQANVSGETIVDTKHNLSITGPGPVKSTTEERICIFCHTPHNAVSDVPYLWNRSSSTTNYITYNSSTLYASVGQPAGSSKLCLSCHDGTIALGAVISEPEEITFAGGIRFMPDGPAKLGTDISDDHPVSFTYDSSLALTSGELADPSALNSSVKLDSDEQLQCTACHDPHDNTYGNFLVTSDMYSNLCTICHKKTGWELALHSISNASWNGAGTDPWQNTAYTTVSANGCANCHTPHTAGREERLLQYYYEEDNCIVCHNGNVADTDIETELIKNYVHAVQDFTGIHDPSEDHSSGTVQDHVECADCHDPHQANADDSPGAPWISGAVSGVTGINSAGSRIDNASSQYEICFKCHADNNVTTTVPIDRDIQQLNTRLEFDSANPSYHPVMTQGRNNNVPSLLSPYTEASIIFCTDCHNNDDISGPSGPHGSNNKYLLEKNYTTQDNTLESSYNYEMCYKCHDRNSILSNESFKKHSKHIQEENSPCSACHDAHGISVTQGTSTNNSHLINFDITIVQSNGNGDLFFEDNGTFSGSCSLNCHGKEHNSESY